MDVKFLLRKKLSILLLSFFGLSIGFADSLNNIDSNNAWFVGATVGGSQLQSHKGTAPNGSTADVPDTYTMNNPGTKADLAVYLGYRWANDNTLFPYESLAIGYQQLGNFGVNGDVEQYSVFDNYGYHLDAASNALMLFGKVDLYQFGSFDPYVSFGVGEAYNKLSHYSENPFSGITPRVSPSYAGSTRSFTYNVGVGVDYLVNADLTFSLGYQYANLGKFKATGVSTWSHSTLSYSHITSNTLLLSASYQFPTS